MTFKEFLIRRPPLADQRLSKMEDLSGIDWKASKPSNQSAGAKGNYYPALRPTPPLSGRSTPSLQPPSSNQKPLTSTHSGSKPSTPANDSFANLVSFNQGQANKNLSLQEQQRLLQDQKRKQEEEKRKQLDGQFGPQAIDAALWDRLGSGHQTPSQTDAAPVSSTPDEEDILAAFNASAPVDRSSHMPPPGAIIDAGKSSSTGLNAASMATAERLQLADDDDDPFGLGMAPVSNQKGSLHKQENGFVETEDSDDVLGLLGKPVSDFPKPQSHREIPMEASPPPATANPEDHAIAELVDMGFPSEKSRTALQNTESGLDVQAAVSWLLNQAHEESSSKGKTSKSQGQPEGRRRRESSEKLGRRKNSNTSGANPAWMRESSSSDIRQSRNGDRQSARTDKDPAQYASDLGNNFFKTANSLWKTGTKKLNQAVAELNSENDPNHPKWMREAQIDTDASKQKAAPADRKSAPNGNSDRRAGKPATQPAITDEALLLESGSGRPTRKQAPRVSDTRQEVLSSQPPPLKVQQVRENHPQPRFLQQAPNRDSKARLTRQALEEESSQVYISPARRKKTPTQTPPAQSSKPPEPEADLLFGDSKPTVIRPSAPVGGSTQQPRPQKVSSLPSRPSPAKRNIPSLSPTAFQQSISARQSGTAAFKRGDYAEATVHYSTALRVLPSAHPLVLPLLANRALSHLKTGDPKSSIVDADSAIELIGPSRGSGETIDLGGDEGIKPMEPYWGKAMMRKAEALEQLEKWADAAEIWRACVSAGVGGATSISARNRCESAARPKSKPAAAPKKAVPRPKASALSDLTPASGQSTEAVNRLRAANQAADKLDDEKFRLADIVDGRVSQWRAGKEANLRALLASLENVLWQDAGWKKTGMAELIQPNKVKIVYMKGIAKVHPDKVSSRITSHISSVYLFNRIPLTSDVASHHCDHRTEDDQRCCLCNVKRGMGEI